VHRSVGSDISHTRDPGTLAAADDEHNHGVTGLSIAGDTHDHVLGGEVDADTHGHAITGATASAGSAAQENRPSYYALAYIMRIS
jgi:hypothetical protein